MVLHAPSADRKPRLAAMRFLMKRSCSIMLFKYGDGRQRQHRPRSPDCFNWEIARAYAACPSTLITRGRLPPVPDNAKRRNSLAAVKSRFGESMKSIVLPAESTARYRYVQIPATLI